MSMQEIARKIERKQLLEKVDILNKLNGKGQEVISKEDILRVIEAKEKELLEEIDYLEKKEASLLGGVYDLSLFDKNILCGNSDLILRKAIEDDKEPYYQMEREYAYFKSNFARPEFKDELWNPNQYHYLIPNHGILLRRNYGGWSIHGNGGIYGGRAEHPVSSILLYLYCRDYRQSNQYHCGNVDHQGNACKISDQIQQRNDVCKGKESELIIT